MTDETAGETLRHHLRERTRARHDRLDARMSESGLSSPGAYSRFLSTQLAARAGIEDWCRHYCPPELCPPLQCEIIRSDLDALGTGPHEQALPFRPGTAIDPIGVVWAIAGSSLGNRAILAQLRKAGAQHLPTTFLADPAMPAFWNRLRPQLDEPASPDVVASAIAGALDVFDHFLAVAGVAQLEEAA